jgi:hypothetical protein
MDGTRPHLIGFLVEFWSANTREGRGENALSQVLKHNFIGTRAEAWIDVRQREVGSGTCLEYIGGESI